MLALFFFAFFASAAVAEEPVAWTVTDSNGREHRSPEELGRPTLIAFWAVWCKPCKPMAKELELLSQKYGDRLVLIAPHLDRNPGATIFARRNDWNFPILNDGSELAARYGVTTAPVMILLDGDGKILWRRRGYADGDLDRLDAKLRTLVPEKRK